MKFFLPFLCALALSAPAVAQPSVPQLQSFAQDSARNVMHTSANGYRVVWRHYEYCTNNLCFNDGLQLEVYDSSGTLLHDLMWEKPYASSSLTQSRISLLDATVDAQDNLIVVGSFRCKVNFSPNDPTPTYFDGDSTNSNSGTMFVAKYRVSDGHFLWAKMMKRVDPSPFVYPMFSFASLATDAAGNIYLMGTKVSGPVNINPGTGAAAVHSGNFLAKYNSAGVYQTSVAADAFSNHYYKKLRLHGANLYGLGAVDSAGKQTYLLAQYNTSTLAITRRKTFGHFTVDGAGAGRNQRVEMVLGKTDIWLLGSAVGSAYIPTTGTPLNITGLANGVRAYYLMRMDAATWNVTDARLLQRSTSQVDCPVALGVDSMQNLMIAGSVVDSINASLTGGPVWIKNSRPFRPNTYLLYYTGSNLALQWAKQIGDTSYVGLTDAVFGRGGNIYVTGAFKGKSTFSFLPGGTLQTGPTTGHWYAANYCARYRWATAGGAAGVGGPALAGGLTLYPNPASSTLYLRLDESNAHEALEITVWSVDGKRLKTQAARGAVVVPVDVAGLMPGAYFLRVAGVGGSAVQRFVKE